MSADRDAWRATDLRGALAAIIADPDCCAASKAIARAALGGCQPQDTASMTQQWTKAELEDWCRGWCRTPHTTLKAFIDAGFCSDQEPSREETRLLRQPALSTVDATKPVISTRPDAPLIGGHTWYRGWEARYDLEAAAWGCEGWYACLGGEDLDCIVVRGRTWDELLDEIDEHHMTGEAA